MSVIRYFLAISVSAVAATLMIGVVVVPAASASEGTCPNEARRVEQGSQFLPDCRAYELVTQPSQPAIYYNAPSLGGLFPPSKFTHLTLGEGNGIGRVEPVEMPETQEGVSTAADGDAALFLTLNEPNSESDSVASDLSRRGPDGWIAENIIPPRARHGFLCDAAEFAGTSSNFEEVAVEIGTGENDADVAEDCGQAEPPLAPNESRESANLFLRNTATGSYQFVNVSAPGAGPYDPQLLATSANGSHLVVASRAQLSPEAPNGEALNNSIVAGHCTTPFGNVYIWSAGEVRLATFLPDGTPVRGTLAGGSPTACGSLWRGAEFTHPVSEDGERVIFYAGGGAEAEAETDSVEPTARYIDGGLYLRERASAVQSALNGSGECTEPDKACTVQIDVPQIGAPTGAKAGGGQFQWASAQDSKIFFTDEEKLTSGATAEVGKLDLYEYDIDKPVGERLTDLTADHAEAAGVLGVAGVSEDGSYVYFVAHADLTGAQQNSHGQTAPGPAKGSGTLSGGVEAVLTSASGGAIKVSVITGEFRLGQELHGVGVAAGTMITACSPSCAAANTITLSEGLQFGSRIGEHLYVLGSPEVTNVNTTSGAFKEGMWLRGPGIAPETMIAAVGHGTITLSQGAAGAGSEALSATAANLYLLHGGATTFITSLSEEGGDRCDWTIICLTSRVSQNGLFIAFDSIDSLTGYDNHPLHTEACSHLTEIAGSPCIESYRYAVEGNELTCATCNPTGAPPASEFAWAVIGQTNKPGVPRAGSMAITNAISDTGQVFFETMEKLVPADENETWDVYEYEGGEGQTARLYLISDGKGEEPSYFDNATADGSNVFFVTFQSLLAADTRADADLYDARVDGGFASQDQPVQAPACTSLNACRSPVSEPPAEFSVASAALAGSGNLAPVSVRPGAEEKPVAKTLTRKQLLARALEVCAKRYGHSAKRRRSCERQARKRYGAKRKSTHPARRNGRAAK